MPRRRMISEALAVWDTEGMTVTGIYTEKGEFQQMRDGQPVTVPKYTLKNDVATIIINGTHDIDLAMAQVHVGETVEIIYKGEAITAAGWPVKKFEVAVYDPDPEGYEQP